MKRTIIQTLLWTVLLSNEHAKGFILRSPLSMSNGDNQIDLYDEPQSQKTSSLTSTSPLSK